MSGELTLNLLWIACCSGLIGFWLTRKYLPASSTFLVVLIRISIPLFYFGWFYDGTWNFLDDLTYTTQGTQMLETGHNPLNVLFIKQGIQKLQSLAGGKHFLYIWWNMLAQYLFGRHYYSAVFLNVLLTFVASYFFYRLILLIGFSVIYARNLAFFTLIHWDIIAWSSFVNLKDILVMTLTIMTFTCIINLLRKITIMQVLNIGLLLFILIWVRFYIPVVLILTTSIWLILYKKGWGKKLLIAMTLFGISVLVLYPAVNGIQENILKLTPSLYGMIRMALTPQPWSIEPAYTFLLIPSILHWMLFIPSLIGCWLIWHRNKFARLFIIYIFLIFFLYGAITESQSVRQRVQLVPFIVWLQFHPIWLVLPRKTISTSSAQIKKVVV